MIPHFPFYAGDWRRSERVRMMTLEQRGAYIDLLALMWESDDCTIKDDDAYLAAQLGISKRKWKALSSQFLTAERPVLTAENGRFSNISLLNHRRKVDEKIAKNSESGKFGAEIKKKYNKNNGSYQANALQQARATDTDTDTDTLPYGSGADAPGPNENPPNSKTENQSSTNGEDTEIWALFLPWLIGKGVVEKNARSFLGAMVKHCGRGETLKLLDIAKRADVADPVPYLRELAKGKGSPGKRTQADHNKSGTGKVVL